jgi:hypothetical protein
MNPAPLSVEACLIPSKTLAVRATREIGVVASALRETSRDAGERPAAAEAVDKPATDCLGRALVIRAMLLRAAISCVFDDGGGLRLQGELPGRGIQKEDWRDSARLSIDRHSTPSCRPVFGEHQTRHSRTAEACRAVSRLQIWNDVAKARVEAAVDASCKHGFIGFLWIRESRERTSEAIPRFSTRILQLQQLALLRTCMTNPCLQLASTAASRTFSPGTRVSIGSQ